MLIEFSTENYRSIKEKVTLSLLASRSDKSLEENTFPMLKTKKERLLRSCVLYGANASGKTNILRALASLKRLVLLSHNLQKGSPLPFNPFKLESSYLEKPTEYEITFIQNGVRYAYKVSFTNEKVVDESLYYYPKNYASLIFERSETNHFVFTKDKKKQKFLADSTPVNILYLSRSTHFNYPRTAEAFNWFKDHLTILGPADKPKSESETIRMLEDEDSKKLILKALETADIHIDDLEATTEKVDLKDLPATLPPKLRQILGILEGEGESVSIRTFHKNIEFDFFLDESEGTQRFFSLLGPCLNALKSGKLLVVDELDTKLHHFLNEFLIKLFHDPKQNRKNAQLIFTTHNVNLLKLDLFRRDQIWFTEKDPTKGSTDLFSLYEFSQRKDVDIKKRYLDGRYGAVPFIKSPGILYGK